MQTYCRRDILWRFIEKQEEIVGWREREMEGERGKEEGAMKKGGGVV